MVKDLVKILLLVLPFNLASANEIQTMKLSERHSGYKLTKDDWVEFFDCWKYQTGKKLKENDLSFLNFTIKEDDAKQANVARVELPQSLLDFYFAYRSFGGAYRKKDIDEGVGIFSPNDIQPLASYMGELISIRNEYPIESNDIDYYRYGIEQNDSSGRTSYLKNAIVIGKYGFSDYELVVLYPDSRTADGEFETALLAHASEIRAPSFTEMMRQLSYLFLQKPDSIPPYSQETLRNTCATKLQLQSVWWK